MAPRSSATPPRNSAPSLGAHRPRVQDRILFDKLIQVPVGTNERERTLLQLVKPLNLGYNSSRAEKALDLTDPAIRDQVLGLYRGYPSRASLAEFCGDLHFAIPSGRVARAHAAFAPTWVYRFDVSTRLLDLLGFGATHGTEIPLVMGDTHSAMERTFGILGGARARRAASIRIQDHWKGDQAWAE